MTVERMTVERVVQCSLLGAEGTPQIEAIEGNSSLRMPLPTTLPSLDDIFGPTKS